MAKEQQVKLIQRGGKIYALMNSGLDKNGNAQWVAHALDSKDLNEKGAYATTYKSNAPYTEQQFVEMLEKDPSAFGGKVGDVQMGTKDGQLVGYQRDKPTTVGAPTHRGFVGKQVVDPSFSGVEESVQKRVPSGYSGDVMGDIIRKLGGKG